MTFRTLKRRRIDVFREVPVPITLVELLAESRPASDQRLWDNGSHTTHRVTAYRWIKAVMQDAGISGARVCPKGLRHGFGIHAVRSGVPITLIQKWLGHANLSTTAIYTEALGPEELEIAQRMWSVPSQEPLQANKPG